MLLSISHVWVGVGIVNAIPSSVLSWAPCEFPCWASLHIFSCPYSPHFKCPWVLVMPHYLKFNQTYPFIVRKLLSSLLGLPTHLTTFSVSWPLGYPLLPLTLGQEFPGLGLDGERHLNMEFCPYGQLQIFF